MQEALRPLGGHPVQLLLVQFALLLVVARLGSELAKRLGLPAVVGELAAGIALGPTLFGHFAPHAFALVFPPVAEQFHLLDVIGNLGMVLLLLLTGIETDLRLLRNLGRPALLASFSGMLVPFAMGFGLGELMPEQYVALPERRVLFSLFLATAMSISAMPVIAKILMDLDLTKRNIGLVILSGGVVDDTTGWLVLSLIAGAVSQGRVNFVSLALTIVYIVGFLAGVALLLYPTLRWLTRLTGQGFRSPDSDLVLIVVTTLLCAALTEKIGIHAVFGAFVAGTVFRQVPSLRPKTVHRLESFVFAVLAPVFFGIVGLRVDLWTLGGGGMLAIVLGVACLGKLVGCTAGGLWSGMHFWEATSVAVAMNARGAMELVVATIGLSLGILTQQMFSIIVVVAVVTSFMAPLMLRLTMRRVRMSEEEEKRILAQESKGVFDPDRVRILVPTAGGPNALGAARLAFGVARRSQNIVQVLFIDPQFTFWRRLLHPFLKSPAGKGIEEHLAKLRALVQGGQPEVRHLASAHVARSICEEARRGTDLIVLGASHSGPLIGGEVVEHVVAEAPCHVAIVKTTDSAAPFSRLLVPIDGRVVSKVAVEFAVRYAEVTGAELTIAVLAEQRPAHIDSSGGLVVDRSEAAPEKELERISQVFRASSIKPTVLHLDYDPRRSVILQQVSQGGYDLIVLGAENRAIQHRLFFGHENERIIRNSPISVAVVVPHIGMLSK